MARKVPMGPLAAKVRRIMRSKDNAAKTRLLERSGRLFDVEPYFRPYEPRDESEPGAQETRSHQDPVLPRWRPGLKRRSSKDR
jgi:hypothetical protein